MDNEIPARNRGPVRAKIVVSSIALAASIPAIWFAFDHVVSSPPRGALWLRPSSFVGLTVLAAVLAVSCVTLYWNIILLRQERVALLNPTAIVFASAWNNDLRAVAGRLRSTVLSARFSAGFTVTVDSEGLAAWRGLVWRPHAILHVPWSNITNISTGTVHDINRNYYGVLVTCKDILFTSELLAVSPPAQVDLAFYASRTAFAPYSAARIDELARRIIDRRPASTASPRDVT